MTTTTISLHVPQNPKAPRLAARLGELFAALLSALTPRPAAAAPDSAAREAARVRFMARLYENTDPRFAAELYAAADRHEMLYGD